MSFLATKIPDNFFIKNSWLFKTSRFENSMLYIKFFKVKKWKKIIPDGASIFRSGFPKKNLEQNDSNYFKKFLIETRRGEFAHWLQIIPVPVFFLWNYWWVGIIMVFYALMANVPCILLQRFNRIRFKNLIKLKEDKA